MSTSTCDIYRAGHAPPAAPDVAGVPCTLQPAFQAGRAVGESEPNYLRYTHILQVALDVDVRDDMDELTGNVNTDTVYIPDQGGTPYRVTFVERCGRGLPVDGKRVYLNRKQP